MKSAWASYFPGLQDRGRNGLLWFCLAPDQVVGDGTERLFEYFGGEAIYMPLVQVTTVAAKLRAMGDPVIVEIAIAPNELHTFSEHPFATNSLSLYHRRVNRNACIHAREGYLTRDVSPNEIVRVVKRAMFFSEYAHYVP